MDIYTIDFETFWDRRDYTLSKMQMSAYVRDPRYQTIMVGIKRNEGKTVVLTDSQFHQLLPALRLEDAAVLCHNTLFDGFILAHHYHVRPRLYLDTLSMGRALYPSARHHSLKALAEMVGVGVKGTEVENTSGKRTLTPEEWHCFALYCANDVDLTFALWQKMKQGFPISEIKLIDLIIRMFTEPRVLLNKALLLEEHTAEVQRKAALLAQCVADKSTLASNDQFASLLESLGVVPPMKLSPAALKKGEQKWTYAFAKTDEGFQALLEHDSEEVRAVCGARLGIKSTINETRALRFLHMAELGPVPIGLAYYAAHTGRLGGTDKVNWQNLTRGSRLRLAVEAPPGSMLVIGDSGQIEARCLAALAGEETLLASFRRADANPGDTECPTKSPTPAL